MLPATTASAIRKTLSVSPSIPAMEMTWLPVVSIGRCQVPAGEPVPVPDIIPGPAFSSIVMEG